MAKPAKGAAKAGFASINKAIAAKDIACNVACAEGGCNARTMPSFEIRYCRPMRRNACWHQALAEIIGLERYVTIARLGQTSMRQMTGVEGVRQVFCTVFLCASRGKDRKNNRFGC